MFAFGKSTPFSIRVVETNTFVCLSYKRFIADNKRVVYGGGGILPDIFVPIDTTRASDYYINLRAKNLINNYALEYVGANRNELLQKYPTYNDFNKNYRRLNIDKLFDKYVADAGVKKTTLKPEWVIKWVGEALKAETKDTISPYWPYSCPW